MLLRSSNLNRLRRGSIGNICDIFWHVRFRELIERFVRFVVAVEQPSRTTKSILKGIAASSAVVLALNLFVLYGEPLLMAQKP